MGSFKKKFLILLVPLLLIIGYIGYAIGWFITEANQNLRYTEQTRYFANVILDRLNEKPFRQEELLNDIQQFVNEYNCSYEGQDFLKIIIPLEHKSRPEFYYQKKKGF